MPKMSGVFAFGRVNRTQVTEDLPVSSGTALEIDTTGDMVIQVAIYVAATFYWTRAVSAVEAATRIGSDTTRFRAPAGFYTIDVAGDSSNKLYIRSAGAAVTDGVSYAFVEAS